jgi:hypothetical protein
VALALPLGAQHVRVPARPRRSFWVVSNNFLPSNIGGDVCRIADTSRPAGSKTLATMVIRGPRWASSRSRVWAPSALFRAMGTTSPARCGSRSVPGDAALVLLASFAPRSRSGAVAGARGHPWWSRSSSPCRRRWRGSAKPRRWPALLRRAHRAGSWSSFYALTARSLAIPLPLVAGWVLVPVAMVVQMAPVSINGFDCARPSSAFFVRFGLSVEAVAVSLLGTALIMLISLGGGALFLLRRH